MSLLRKLFLILSTTGIGCIAYFGYLCPIKNNLEDNPNHIHEKQSGQLQDFFMLADVASSNRRLSTISTNSHIRIFDLKSYEEALKSHPIQQDLCVLKHLFKVSYHICTHDPKQDRFVSNSILHGMGWEVDLTQFLSEMLQAYGNEAILLDVGANIGSHLLFAAAKGYSVWGVEPQVTNLVKMYHAAQLDFTDSRITFIQNTLDKKYMKVSIKQTIGNVGGSYVINDINKGPSLEAAQSILFADVLEHIQFNRSTTKNLTIILKIDIESYECRAFLGSPQILNSPNYYIPYVVMEWTYAQGRPPYKYPQACPRESVLQMSKLFIENGYVPFSSQKVMLDVDKSDTWVTNVIWQHQYAHPIMPNSSTHQSYPYKPKIRR